MKKILFSMTCIFLCVCLLIPLDSVLACSGTGCRGDDPTVEEDSLGRKCWVTAYTVYGGYYRSGTNGRVYNELRYSTGCVANWSRATVAANNANTKNLFAKVWEKPNDNYRYHFYIQGNPLPTGSSCFTDMASGTVTTVSFVGISSVSWSGPYDPLDQYDG